MVNYQTRLSLRPHHWQGCRISDSWINWLGHPPAELPSLPLTQPACILNPGSVIHCCLNLRRTQGQVPYHCSPKICSWAMAVNRQTSKVGLFFHFLLHEDFLVIGLILNILKQSYVSNWIGPGDLWIPMCQVGAVRSLWKVRMVSSPDCTALTTM